MTHHASPFLIPLLCGGLLAAGCTTAPVTVPQAPAAARHVNSLGMELVLIPAGEFMMGSDDVESVLARDFPDIDLSRMRKLQDETPRHRVRITRAFYMGRFEVTRGQFRQFVAESGYVPESIADGTGAYGYNPDYDPKTTTRGDAFEGRHPRYSWQNPGFAQDDRHPVVNITWHDAVALAQWLSRKEGRTYRLPTEAEWEYTCRAGQTTRFDGGDTPDALRGRANVFDLDTATRWPQWQSHALNHHDGYSFTAPVGSFAPNPFGLHDMHGNAWEWTADWHGEDYYRHSPVDDPQGPPSGDVRVRRGGSWHTWPFYARCAFRNWNSPGTRYTLVGMRLVMEAPR